MLPKNKDRVKKKKRWKKKERYALGGGVGGRGKSRLLIGLLRLESECWERGGLELAI